MRTPAPVFSNALDGAEGLVDADARLAEGLGDARRRRPRPRSARMRAPAWNSSTRVPKALKIEATCAPVAPAPSTIIEAGIDVSDQASLCVAVSSKPGHVEPPADATGAEDDLVGDEAQAALGLERVRVDEARRAGVFVHGDARRLELPAEHGVLAHVVDDLAHARQQPRIVERRLADGDAVAPELPRVAHEPRRVRQRAHRHRSVVRRHAAESRRARRAPCARRGRPRASAATSPAGPAPMTTTSNMLVRVAHVRSSASQRSARSPGMKPYSPPRVTTKRGKPAQAPRDRPPRNREARRRRRARRRRDP